MKRFILAAGLAILFSGCFVFLIGKIDSLEKATDKLILPNPSASVIRSYVGNFTHPKKDNQPNEIKQQGDQHTPQIRTITPSNSFFSQEIVEGLYKFIQAKESFASKQKLSDFLRPTFFDQKTLGSINAFYNWAIQESVYDSKIEDLRILAIDYLGECANGNIEFEDKSLAQELVENLLNTDLDQKADQKLMRSLIGDKIDLLAIFTQIDENYAAAWLKERPVKKYLTEGFFNGLYLKGAPQNVIESFKQTIQHTNSQQKMPRL